jgi:hypothetical protein
VPAHRFLPAWSVYRRVVREGWDGHDWQGPRGKSRTQAALHSKCVGLREALPYCAMTKRVIHAWHAGARSLHNFESHHGTHAGLGMPPFTAAPRDPAFWLWPSTPPGTATTTIGTEDA